MRRPVASLGFAAGFLAFWFLCSIVELPLPWYLPLEHRWAIATQVPGLGMEYFGRLFGATLAGLLGAAAGALLSARIGGRWLKPGAGGVLALALLDAVLQLLHPA